MEDSESETCIGPVEQLDFIGQLDDEGHTWYLIMKDGRSLNEQWWLLKEAKMDNCM